jgi:hypothetical protein
MRMARQRAFINGGPALLKPAALEGRNVGCSQLEPLAVLVAATDTGMPIPLDSRGVVRAYLIDELHRLWKLDCEVVGATTR